MNIYYNIADVVSKDQKDLYMIKILKIIVKHYIVMVDVQLIRSLLFFGDMVEHI